MICGAGGEHSTALEPRGGSASGFCRPRPCSSPGSSALGARVFPRKQRFLGYSISQNGKSFNKIHANTGKKG